MAPTTHNGQSAPSRLQGRPTSLSTTIILSTFPALDSDRANAVSASYVEASKLEKAIIHPMTPIDTSKNRSSSISSTHISNWKTAFEPTELPAKRHNRVIRHLYLTVFSVYRRIFSVIFLTNMVGVFFVFRNPAVQPVALNHLATWASANFLVCILIRQDFSVNFIFRSAWLIPWCVPLRIRRIAARAYNYGGIHSGTAVAGTMWFVAFTALTTRDFVLHRQYTLPVLVLTWLILVVLVIILLTAFPALRMRYHNTFELAHRFLGWISILLFWGQLLLLTMHTADSADIGSAFVRNPTFWMLAVITALLIYPWLRIRRWTFTPEQLSAHALRLHFTQPVHRFSAVTISSSPLREWHPFATFPSVDAATPGSSMVVSAAGDWTRQLVLNSQRPTRLWVRGVVKAGVLSLSCMFRRVIIVTTGSGIGPALSSMALAHRPAAQFCRLIWSTRDPLATYGAKLVAEVRAADPEALILDTTAMGRPDLVAVAWKMWRDSGAEAVFVLSNQAVTRKVVYGLEARGVPVFGPVFDS